MIGLHHSGAPLLCSPDQSAASGRQRMKTRQGQQDFNIVRVAAKTAMPIVSSVPKCRGSRRTSAGHLGGPPGQPMSLLMARPAGRHSAHYEPGVAAREPDERVLLIVNDDHLTGGGVPIIGRRVASKSAGRLAGCEAPPQKRVIDYSQPPSIQVDALQPVEVPMSAKVVGRRSHRIQQQVLRSQAPFMQPASSLSSCSPASASSSRLRRHSAREAAGQPMRDADRAVLQLHLFSGKAACEHGEPVQGRYNLVHSDSTRRRPQPQAAQQIPCTSSCCSLSSTTSDRKTSRVYEEPADYCRDPCCEGAGYEEPAGDYCDETCGCEFAPTRHSRLAAASRRRHHGPCQASDNGYLAHQGGALQARCQSHRSSSCSERRRSAQANFSAPPQVPAKPHLNLVAMSELMNQQRLSRSIQQMRQAPVSPPQPGEADESASAAVSQMYESLAAELKAKLGNPRTAPILLPPKDYDTLSRRQGKLTGIELRRSTNPQLVGPALSQPGAGSHRKEPAQQQQHQQQPEAGPGSSGRGSQADERDHLSRSNSSSGLGSISLGANSPSSSASSNSNADERRRRQDSNQVIPPECQSPSLEEPAGASSDSGHSGSGSGRFFKYGNSNASPTPSVSPASSPGAKQLNQRQRPINDHHPGQVSDGVLWNGRVEIPLKVNSEKHGNTYLATKQIIY